MARLRAPAVLGGWLLSCVPPGSPGVLRAGAVGGAAGGRSGMSPGRVDPDPPQPGPSPFPSSLRKQKRLQKERPCPRPKRCIPGPAGLPCTWRS